MKQTLPPSASQHIGIMVRTEAPTMTRLPASASETNAGGRAGACSADVSRAADTADTAERRREGVTGSCRVTDRTPVLPYAVGVKPRPEHLESRPWTATS